MQCAYGEGPQLIVWNMISNELTFKCNIHR